MTDEQAQECGRLLVRWLLRDLSKRSNLRPSSALWSEWDAKYFREKLYAALGIPKEFLEPSVSSASLWEVMNDRFGSKR